MTIISEKTCLIIFSIALSVIVVLLLALIIPQGFIEYNLGISIATSLVSTAITIVFLSLFLMIRGEREWSPVKRNVYAMIGTELGPLFSGLLSFTESEIDVMGFQSSLLYTKDNKIRKEIILSKLAELQKKEPLQLIPSSVSVFRSEKGLFLDTKRNLRDAQIMYGRHLNPTITEKLMNVQDLLEAMNMTFEVETKLNNLQSQLLPYVELMHKLMPQMRDEDLSSTALIQKLLPAYVKSLIQKTYELWNLGIEFDLA